MYRDLRKLGSLTGNNFFLFVFGLLGRSGGFLQLLLGLLLLFPFTSDPLRKIPADRLQSWPLSKSQRALLRAVSVWFSPVAWITVGLLIWASSPQFAAAFLGLSVLVYGAGAFFTAIPARAPRLNALRYIPEFGGAIGGLVRKNLRELLSTLDVYLGLVLSVSGLVYRLVVKAPDRDALMMLALLVALALSTYALCLFGLDTASGFTRYRLLPLRGWQILLAKDLGFTIVAMVLVLPLAPLAGFAAALMALAVGHQASITQKVPQTPWRFTGGASLATGLLQAFLMFSAGTLVSRTSALVLIPCAAIYLGSLWYFGRQFERAAELDFL